MTDSVSLQTVCAPSDDIVAREIEGEIIIVPLVAGIGDADDELYTLNETGQAIWAHLDGQKTLAERGRPRSAPSSTLRPARSRPTCSASPARWWRGRSSRPGRERPSVLTW